MLFRYILFHYVKNMLILLFTLTGLFTGLDFLIGGTSLPSFNIKVLYIFNRWQESLNLLYPLAIIFGAIWTKISFIKQNTLGALYALGVSRIELFKPFLFASLFTYFLFVGLNFTSFATASDVANALKKKQYHTVKNTEDLFFKYDDSFVYIKTLIPVEKKLESLTLFRLKDYKVFEIIEAKEAEYIGSEWLAKGIKRQKIISQDGKKRLKIDYLDTLVTLKDYNPKILNSIYENKKLTLYESVIAKKLLSTQGVGTYKVRADVYNRVVTPLFSIALLMILLFRFPFHARYINIVTVTTKALAGTLFIWGIMFAAYRMGLNGVVSPEIAMILPVLLLWIFAIYSLIESKNRI
ncbi:MAG: YjgP/YjgQ family permease [Epsilonproteobacteria bacterium]|nr:YjgP/YjgQ family permease [Campylobacterota bacterium]